MAIQKLTKLKVADNSGGLIIQCIHIVGSTGKFIGQMGDIFIGTIKKAIPGAGVKKSDVVAAVIVRTKRQLRRKDGTYISFAENAAVILKSSKEKDIKGTRVFGVIPRELRAKGFNRIVSLAGEVV